MNEKEKKELLEKILKGLDLAVEKLIRERQKEDGELVYSVDGKIVFVKARDLVKP
jgi:hypothetical protein